MSVEETARTNYESVRNEILERIRLRDNVLVVYLGAIGAILGVSLGDNATNPKILLIIPYLALGATAIISQHHSMIGSLGDFLARELQPFLKKIGADAPQWDTSKAIRARPHRLAWMGRRYGHLLLIDIPAVAALAINWQHSVYLPLPEMVLWWSGAILTTLSVLVILETSRWLRELHQHLNNGLKALEDA